MATQSSKPVRGLMSNLKLLKLLEEANCMGRWNLPRLISSNWNVNCTYSIYVLILRNPSCPLPSTLPSTNPGWPSSAPTPVTSFPWGSCVSSVSYYRIGFCRSPSSPPRRTYSALSSSPWWCHSYRCPRCTRSGGQLPPLWGNQSPSSLRTYWGPLPWPTAVSSSCIAFSRPVWS